MKLATAVLLLVATSANAEPTFTPGDFSNGNSVSDPKGGTLYLANGLIATPVAFSGQNVILSDSSEGDAYHYFNDGGAAIAQSDGSYIYVSNSETGSYPDDPVGATYALKFDTSNQLVGYQKLLGDTAKNCAGGQTPWGTWIACEETRDYGRCWQVDPTGEKEPARTFVTGQALDGSNAGEYFGKWEAFAWDSDTNTAYVTNDDYPGSSSEEPSYDYQGAIVRFTPDETALACLEADDKWCALESGTVDYLQLTPSSDGTTGTFDWVADKNEANPAEYGGSEGAHVEGGIFTFATAKDRYLFRLNLNDKTYTRSAVPFSQEADNLRILGDDAGEDVVYLCTDGDDNPGDALWRWDANGASRLFYEVGHSYPAGVDFTADKKIMYVSMFNHTTYQLTREDGMAFDEDMHHIVYEVDGGIDAGKTHDDIADQVNAIQVADGASDAEDSTEDAADEGGADTDATAQDGDAEEVETDSADKSADSSTSNGATAMTASLVMSVVGTLML